MSLWRGVSCGASCLVVLMAGSAVLAEQGPRAAAAKLKNPVASSPASIAAGELLYQKQCRLCHGATGRADSAPAKAMKASDLTDGAWTHGGSDGEIFTAIQDGTGPDSKMKGFKGKLSDQDTWHVVNYIRSLARK